MIATRRALAAAAALVPATFAACVPSPHGSPPDPSDVLGSVEVLEVTDGDSVSVMVDGDRLRIRLAGINAPESDDCLGPESGDSLRSLLDGRTVTLEPTDIDQYGRTVAYVSAGGTDVNVAQVEQGMAIALTDGGRLEDEILDAEARARTTGLGWWDPDSCGDSDHPGVVVELVEPDPPGPDDEHLDQELAVIKVEMATDISGWTLRDESTVNRLVFPPGTVVTPGEPLEIRSDCQGFGWCTGRSIWNNGGDAAILLAPGGSIVAIDRYRP